MKDRRKSWQGKTKTSFTKCGHLTRARGRNIADANRRQKPKTLAEYADAMGITETEAQRLMEKHDADNIQRERISADHAGHEASLFGDED